MDLTPEQLAALAAETRGPTTLVVVIFFTVFAFISVCLRFISKFVVIKSSGTEDYFIGVSMVSASCHDNLSLGAFTEASRKDIFYMYGSLYDSRQVSCPLAASVT